MVDHSWLGHGEKATGPGLPAASAQRNGTAWRSGASTLPRVGDEELIGRLRAGDPAAFGELVDCYHTSMVRLAETFVPNRAVAEEVVQDTWVAVIRGIDRFEARSSLKTWIFHILANRARSTGARERRVRPVDFEEGRDADMVGFGRGGMWSDPPVPWSDEVDDRLSAAGTLAAVRSVLEQLPESQRAVVTLRDVEGLSPREVSEVLDLSDANQRVLLHRGRARVRAALEREVRAR